MNLESLFGRFNLKNVSLGPQWAKVEFDFKDEDRNAAWELYVEMLTRIVTQPLPASMGDERTALESIHSLFPITREVLRRRGPETVQFSRVAIPILNQVVRPFTAKWHREFLAGAFGDPVKCRGFREELELLQADLRNYNRLLADIVGVEDLTDLERLEEGK